jgi:hypothetical protein
VANFWIQCFTPAVFASTLIAAIGAAQQGTPQPALAGVSNSPTTSEPQQQGQSEQVHTGTTSGLDSEARLEALLTDHQFFRIESELGQMTPEQSQFYRGILANRDNDSRASIQLLAPLIDKISASGNTEQEKLLRKALAEDYLRTGDMAKAASAYQALVARLHAHLSSEEQDEIELPLKLAPLAAADHAQPAGPYRAACLRGCTAA